MHEVDSNTCVNVSFMHILGEPWHVGVSTAGSLHTITLLPIPQGIIGKR